jgi:heat-inducible transcriptional repressor
MTASYQLDDRAQRLLRELVQAYTRDGQPVGSKTLLRLSRLDVSSATVRNIMARLEQMGLVAQPHTSAGRVPTAAGYRFFIDSLLEVRDPDPRARQALSAELSPSKTTQDLVHTATGLLSQMTRLAGVISVSRPPQIEVRHLEFMKLTDRRVLVILVINSDQVHNRVIQVDRDYSELELSEAARLIGRYLIGSDFSQALARLREEIRQHRDDVASILESTLEVMGAVCGESDRDELLTAGESNLLQFAELQDINKLRELFEVFNQKRELLRILEGCADAEGVQIFIGSESGYDVLEDCSVVGAPYRIGDEVVGVLGVIGPTRIAYDRIIPAVDLTAKILSSALNSAD